VLGQQTFPPIVPDLPPPPTGSPGMVTCVTISCHNYILLFYIKHNHIARVGVVTSKK